DGTTQDLTPSGHWSSTAAGVATISNTAGTAGLASTLGTGTTTIGISSGSVSAEATLVVNAAALLSIAISPQNPSIPLGTSQPFSAMGTCSDGSTQDVTASVTWTSSFPAVAPVTAAGLVTANMLGSTSITASSSTVTSSATVAVTAPILVSVSVSPVSGSIAKGTSQQFTATGTYSDGSIQDIT